VPLELRTAGAEERVERGEDANRAIAGPFDREIEAERETEQHPCGEAEEREKHL
jgi:hypothetical protein